MRERDRTGAHRVAQGDPVTREIVKNALTSIADEMALTVIRTAHSQIVRDTMDFATVLFDPEGRVVAQGATLPLHLGAMPDAMEYLLARHAGDINRGDVFIVNDPDQGGMHLPDIFLLQPIFDGEERIAFSGITAHQADIGGRTPGGNGVDSRSIFEEGLQIPLLKLFDRGSENTAILALLARNVRVPHLVLGDVRAQLAAARTAEVRLLELVGRYGRDVLIAYMDDILDATERLVKLEIARIPNGTWKFEDAIDDDGFGSGPLPIVATIIVGDKTLHVSFEGTAPQVGSALNGTVSIVRAAVYAALMAVMDTTAGLACNDGFTRPIKVSVPPGSILNPRRPAARAARGLTGARLVDALLGALHKALPDRVPAAGDGGVSVVALGTTDRDGNSHILADTLSSGWGARADRDGLDGVSGLAANLANAPVEVLEAGFPIRVEEYGFVPDTGGPGRFRGCLAVRRRYRFLGDNAVLQLRSDRRTVPPYGLDGGLCGTPSSITLNPGTDGEQLLGAKVTTGIKHDDVVEVVTPSGGGYGHARDRSHCAIQEDLLTGKISEASALTVYGWQPQSSGTGVDDGRSLETERR